MKVVTFAVLALLVAPRDAPAQAPMRDHVRASAGVGAGSEDLGLRAAGAPGRRLR